MDYTQYRVTNYTPQQLKLTHKMDYYYGEQHNNKRYDWNGSRVAVDDAEQYLLTGTYPMRDEVNSVYIPLQYRRPNVPVNFAKLIVNRFTSLLFGTNNRPQIRNKTGDEEFLNNIITQPFWNLMRQARVMGGSSGVSIVGFHFEKGNLKYDLFDPRYTYISGDPLTGEIDQLHIIYYFVKSIPKVMKIGNKDQYMYVDTEFVYRRLITPEVDIEFVPLEKKEAEEVGKWEVKTLTKIPFGFVPVIMLQNMPHTGSFVGESDYEDILPLMDAFDIQYSQANRGTAYNSDPTLALYTDKKANEPIRKGSGHAIVLERGGKAEYLELGKGGPQLSLEMSQDIEDRILELAQVVINPGTGAKTAEEIRRRYESMYDKADILRTQYGYGIHQLLNKIILAVNIIRKSGLSVNIQGELPQEIELTWPDYVRPSSTDNLSTVQQIILALQNNLITHDIAVRKIGNILNIEDIEGVLNELQAKQNLLGGNNE